MCLAGLDGKAVEFAFFPCRFLHTAVIYLFASFAFFLGFLGYTKDRLLGVGEIIGGKSLFVVFSGNTPTTLLPAINISHIFGWPSYVRFYALATCFCFGFWEGGWISIINGLFCFHRHLSISPLLSRYFLSSISAFIAFSDTLFVYYPFPNKLF